MNLLILLLLFNPTLGQLFYSTTDLKISAKKDISKIPDFLVNIQAIIEHLAEKKAFFPISQDPLLTIAKTTNIINGNANISVQHTAINTDPKLKALKDIINNMILLNGQTIEDCTEHLSIRLANCKLKYGLVTNTDNDRKSRGIPFLGELIATLTDLPSPEAWGHQTQIIKDLVALANNETVTMNTFSEALDDQQEFVGTIKTAVEAFTIFNEELTTLEQYATSITLDNFKINNYCKKANEYLDHFEFDVIDKLTKMKENALNFKPDPWMFPKKSLSTAIKNFHDKNHKQLVDPFTHKTHQIYNLDTAISTINKNMLLSILSVPTIDFTFSYEFIEHPKINEENVNILNHLSSLALKNLDTFACIPKNNYISIISSKDLQKCKKWQIKDLFICHQRTIRLQNSGENCNTFEFNHSIAIELTPTLILLKTKSEIINIKCNNSEKSIKNPPLFFKLEAPTHCTIEGEDFFIDKYYPNSIETLEPSDIGITSQPTPPNFTALEASTFLESTKHFEAVENTQQKFEKDIQEIHTLQENNKMLLSKVNTDENTFDFRYRYLAPYAFFIFLGFIGFFTLVITIIAIYSKCKPIYEKRKRKRSYDFENAPPKNKIQKQKSEPQTPPKKRQRRDSYNDINQCLCLKDTCKCAELD